jgi:type IV secretory pathway TraG/TraD family ATPase VirD4
VTPVWRAFANMSRAAVRDPLWALGCVIFGPIRGGAYLAKSLLMGTIVAPVLLLGIQFVMETLRLKGSWLHRWADLGAGLVTLAMIWRFATRPLIDHFGDRTSDTHGSARFADKKEVRPLVQVETGLLIGRDPESGALLRYDGSAGEAHWNEEAKALLAGVILYVVAHEPPGRPTLSTMRELITSAPDVFQTMLGAMQRSEDAGRLVARAANRHLAKSDREAAGVRSAAQRHTHFLDSPRMARV